MAKKKNKKKRLISVTIEDYERFNKTRGKKKFFREVGLPARALSNPRLEACKKYYEYKNDDKRPISQRVCDLKKGAFLPFVRVISTPMGGNNKN